MRLQTRLFLWFLAAVVCGAFASAIVVYATQPPAERPGHVFARTLAGHIADRWDDNAACESHLREVREMTGVEYTLVRGTSSLPEDTIATGKAGITTYRNGLAYVPVLRNGNVVGALTTRVEPPPGRWNRQLAGVLVSIVVFAFAARRVSRQIARPLERVAEAADRLGGGNLGARAQVDEREGTEALRVGRAFDTMAGRVERLVRDQRELLGAVSHELRSPLGRARVALEIAREQEDKNRALDRLGAQLDDLDMILGDLLSVTRVGLTDLRKRRIEIGAWLTSLLNPEDASIIVSGEYVVDVDPELLARVVHNLVGNARAHGHPENEPVTVDIHNSGNSVRVVVRDRGKGFPSDIIERAFEPFVRGDPARTHGKPISRFPPNESRQASVGLGLAIVKRIVEAHGGNVAAENLPNGAGAEVWFELPLASKNSIKPIT